MDDDKNLYYEYYNRVISEGKNGFKLVVGGTGLGKTSGIIDVVRFTPEHNDRRFIYCANRIQLLNEMGEKLRKNNIQYAHLHSDFEIVLKVILGHHKNDFDKLLQLTAIQNPKSSKKSRITYTKLVETVNNIRQLNSTIDLKSQVTMEQFLQTECRDIIRFFQVVLTEYQNPKDHQNLIDNPAIQALFPYLAFKLNPQIKILLITVQKAFRGFFDGKKIVSLSNLKDDNGNHIIFLDEFDFLENDLIDLLCDTKQINHPFRFVEFFYNQMKNHKLPLETYPINSTDTRKRIEEIVEIIDKLRDEAHINFPTINQFTSSLPVKTAIFQTNHTVMNTSLYLEQTERSFQIVQDRENEGVKYLKAIRLFNAVHNASTRIVYLFKHLEQVSPLIYEEILRHCFETTDFITLIPLITQLPRLPQQQYTRFDTLLESGYGLYEIQDLQQQTDAQEVTFRHYSIYTSPEKILYGLVKNNLVFGLSATADIPRQVRSFSLEWLKKQKDVTYFDITDRDIDDVRRLNDIKQKTRNNKIQVMSLSSLDSKDKPLTKFIKAIAVDEGFGGDDMGGYRRERVEKFFATLNWIIDQYPINSETIVDTHLMFFNTFSQIKYLFDRYQQPEEGFYKIQKQTDNDWFASYECLYRDREFIIIFYDATQAKAIHSSQEAKKHYHKLFWAGKPVVLITQYPSAGNGVNLQYLFSPDSESEIDFNNIHLLEAPYFFFGQIHTEEDPYKHSAILKKNFWYLAKLFEGKIITDKWFRSLLDNIRKPKLNDDYHKGIGAIADDALLNRMAVYIQAIGRIERVWVPMVNQNIVLSSDVFKDFQVFCTRPQYEYILEKRKPIISNNLQQVFEQISLQTQTSERLMRRIKDERLINIQLRCKESIEKLVGELENIRLGNDFDNSIKNKWENLRKTVLRHDFNSSILTELNCVFSTPYYENGILRINQKYDIFPPSIQHNEINEWKLDSIYLHISQNSIIREHFEDRGYELGFNGISRQFFTPHCYQSILIGAIGEEAIKAILLHENIELESMPDKVYELADIKIAKHPIFIDCKNYNERTLDRFDLLPEDIAYRPKLNDTEFKKLAVHKLKRIRMIYANAKLIVINLASGDNRPYQLFNIEFEKIDELKNADFVIVQGVLNQENPRMYNKSFEQFLSNIKNWIEEQP